MIKILINNEEVVCDSNLQIKEEMLSTSSTILKNCYPKSWEDTKDYTNNFYFPKDYSKCEIYDVNGEDETLIFCDELNSSVHFFNDASEILELKNQITGNQNNQTCSTYSIVPKKIGTDILTFDIELNGHKIRSITYKFIVSQDMTISYEIISDN